MGDKRSPGRPRRIEPAPTDADAVRFESEALRLERAVGEHPVVVIASQEKDTAVLVDALLVEAARESAELRWLRERAQSRGQNIERLATRRIRVLGAIADLVLLAAKARAGRPTPGQLRAVAEQFVSAVEREAEDVLPAADLKRFVETLRSRVRPGDAEAVYGAEP